LGYPTADEELRMLQGMAARETSTPATACLTLEQLAALTQKCRAVYVESSVQQYMVNLVQATRQHSDVSLGVSPRGTIALYQAAQARAFIKGRDYTTPDDVKFLAPYVLTHRIVTSGNKRSSQIVDRLLQEVAIP
jgi:MoxR-like ATPase